MVTRNFSLLSKVASQIEDNPTLYYQGYWRSNCYSVVAPGAGMSTLEYTPTVKGSSWLSTHLGIAHDIGGWAIMLSGLFHGTTLPPTGTHFLNNGIRHNIKTTAADLLWLTDADAAPLLHSLSFLYADREVLPEYDRAAAAAAFLTQIAEDDRWAVFNIKEAAKRYSVVINRKEYVFFVNLDGQIELRSL